MEKARYQTGENPRITEEEKRRVSRIIRHLCFWIAVLIVFPLLHNAAAGQWTSVYALLTAEVGLLLTFLLNRFGHLT